MSNISQKLTEIRKAEGITQRTVAHRLEIPATEYHLWEAGLHTLTVDELVRCAEALCVPVSEFFEEPSWVVDRVIVMRAYRSALTLQLEAHEGKVGLMVDQICAELLKLIPEMEGKSYASAKGVSPWPLIGQRRLSDELSKREEQIIPSSFVSEQEPYSAMA